MDFSVKPNGHIIDQNTRTTISNRYKRITRTINNAFWNSNSDTLHSIYVGSYGRGTAVNTSDLDILVELPISERIHFSSMAGNSQSRLLQAVRNSILTTYPNTEIRADGQVVIIKFSDGMKFELLPAFQNMFPGSYYWDGTYSYPDTHMGGRWLSTNPKAEQEAMKTKNGSDYSNGLLFDTCKHIRYLRDTYFSSLQLSGILIDTFVYNAIGNWHWCKANEQPSDPISYEQHLLNWYSSNTSYGFLPPALFAPGSNMTVDVHWSTKIGHLQLKK